MNNRHLMVKLILTGCFIAALAYWLHPDVGQFKLTMNGNPVADPLARIAALPTFIMVVLFTAVLTLLLFFGVGLLIFFAALLVSFLLVAFIAPFFWPILLLIVVLLTLLSVPWPDPKR